MHFQRGGTLTGQWFLFMLLDAVWTETLGDDLSVWAELSSDTSSLNSSVHTSIARGLSQNPPRKVGEHLFKPIFIFITCWYSSLWNASLAQSHRESQALCREFFWHGSDGIDPPGL